MPWIDEPHVGDIVMLYIIGRVQLRWWPMQTRLF
jgi:hypothetical protein